MDLKSNPDSIRTVNPQSYPQFPFARPPAIPERSEPRYGIRADTDQRVAVRDGTRLALDVFRPAAPGQKFPALVGFSPYTRQLQQSDVPIGQNEAGIKEFWVPRGYAQVVVDVRGTNDSEGAWDMFGQIEQADLADIVEWVAAQPWCNGNVGMTGASYFGRTQLMAAEQQPPSLKAIFAYDAATDAYRDTFFHGGIPSEGMQRIWMSDVSALNLMSGRLGNPAAMNEKFEIINGLKYPFDGPFYWDRSSWPRLDRIKIPVYFGCHWAFYNLHLRGAFSGWEGVHGVPKRMALGPSPSPRRPVAEYHHEALRWYDHWLKGMDTRVTEGAPIQLWIQGENVWRGEQEWPLARTQWRELFLCGSGGPEGTLDWTAGPDGERSYDHVPGSDDWLWGHPKLVYRTAPVDRALEITGPVVLHLWAASSAVDTDWLVTLLDEAPDGRTAVLTKGWLRASHRALDPVRSKPYQPWHPHDRRELLDPERSYEFTIEIISTCNVFQPGHRVRLEIASCDSMAENPFWYHRSLVTPAENTVLEGRSYPSRLIVPVIPR